MAAQEDEQEAEETAAAAQPQHQQKINKSSGLLDLISEIMTIREFQGALLQGDSPLQAFASITGVLARMHGDASPHASVQNICEEAAPCGSLPQWQGLFPSRFRHLSTLSRGHRGL